MANRAEKATLDQATDAHPTRVSLWARASDGTLVPVAVDSAGNLGGAGGSNPAGDGAVGTGTTTSVASVTTVGGVTILAANTARYGATIANDDANELYILLGAGTVSATVYTYKLAGYSGSGSVPYYEVPYGFTGIITGLWSGDGSGSARITEFS